MVAKYSIFIGLNKRNLVMCRILSFAILVGLLCTSIQAVAAPVIFEVGAAEARINPSGAVYLAGYQHGRKSTGVHDDLYAKAVVVCDKENAIAIVSVDCIGLPYPLVQRIRDLVETQIPREHFNADRIVISSTHTHAAPDVIGLWGESPAHSGTDSAYIEHLVQTTAAVIVTAWKKRTTATAKYAVTSFGEGWVENVSEKNELDREVSILQFVNRRGKNIASLINFACHPTILSKENTLVSADFPAGLYKKLQTDVGGVNLYLQGAVGGWIQPEKVPRTFEEAEKRGMELGEAVIAALKNAIPLEDNSLAFAARLWEVPVTNPVFKNLAAAHIIRRDIAEGVLTELAWFSIGEASFVTHPGESSPLYSLESKKLMRNKGPRFVLGLGMDELGYLLKPDFFEPDTSLHAAPYLTGMSPGRNAGSAMMRLIKELAEDNQ